MSICKQEDKELQETSASAQQLPHQVVTLVQRVTTCVQMLGVQVTRAQAAHFSPAVAAQPLLHHSWRMLSK
jgi:hypothetical protein